MCSHLFLAVFNYMYMSNLFNPSSIIRTQDYCMWHNNTPGAMYVLSYHPQKLAYLASEKQLFSILYIRWKSNLAWLTLNFVIENKKNGHIYSLLTDVQCFSFCWFSMQFHIVDCHFILIQDSIKLLSH